jgi:hypothetical protein
VRRLGEDWPETFRTLDRGLAVVAAEIGIADLLARAPRRGEGLAHPRRDHVALGFSTRSRVCAGFNSRAITRSPSISPISMVKAGVSPLGIENIIAPRRQ